MYSRYSQVLDEYCSYIMILLRWAVFMHRNLPVELSYYIAAMVVVPPDELEEGTIFSSPRRNPVPVDGPFASIYTGSEALR